MAPLPKRKYAKARQGQRRAHLGLVAPVVIECPQCHSPKRPHHACPTCGSYNGRDAVEIKTPKPKKAS
jgi:large subunit ribosomal protein L32